MNVTVETGFEATKSSIPSLFHERIAVFVAEKNETINKLSLLFQLQSVESRREEFESFCLFRVFLELIRVILGNTDS